MLKENTTVSICENSNQVQGAVAKLAGAGFDLKRISVIGRAFGSNGKPVAYYTHGDRLACWGEQNEFWDKLIERAQEVVLFDCTGTGSLLVIGPIALWIIAVLNNSAIFNGLSVFGATLYSMGLPKERVQDYEEALRKGSYLMIVHGPADEIMQAKKILRTAKVVHLREDSGSVN
jgi:hypothetical protein